MAKRTVVTLPGDGIGGVVLPEAILDPRQVFGPEETAA